MSYLESAYTWITWVGEGLLYFVGFALVMMAQDLVGHMFAGVMTVMGYWSLRLFGIDRSFVDFDPICALIGFAEFLAIILAVIQLFGLNEVS